MEDLEAIFSLVESITLIGFLLGSLRYVDSLRREEQTSEKERTNDIIDDWKRMRQLED